MKQPKPPNPYQQAAATQKSELGASMGSSIINNPNIYTPYGSQTYQNAGYETIYDAQGKPQYIPRYNQVQTLSPDQQRLLGLQTQTQYNLGQTGVQASSKLKDIMGTGVDTSGWQGWNAGPQAAKLATTFGGDNPMTMAIGNQEVRQDTGPTDRGAIESAMMQSYGRATNPAQQAENAQLAARGLSPGGAMFGRVQQGREDARGEASRQAYLAPGQESRQAQDAYNQAAAQRFGQEANIGQFANSAQQQAYQQALQRGQFSNEALTNMFSMGGTAADRANAVRQGQMQESLGLRNQSLNEIMAMLQGGQVSMPQFSPYSAQGIGAAPTGSYMGQNYANAANQFNSGLFNLGSSLVGGGVSMWGK
jgi:hypothetical protein